MTKNRTYITLFSSAGVGCYGFKLNGFDCIATNELLDARLNVQRANHKCKYETGYINGDITQKETHGRLFREIEMWREKEELEQVDVVFATPPCQGMSTANYKKTDDEQIRNSLVVQAIHLVSQIQPKIFVFENVRAFMNTICTDTDGEDKLIKDSIYNNLSDRYNIYYRVINFKDFGVPSSRPRTIVIGTSKDCKNLSPLALFPSRHKEIVLRDAIGDLPHLDYGEKDKSDFLHFARLFPQEQLTWIKNLKEGQSAFEQPIEFQPGHYDDKGNKVVNKGAYMGNKYRRLVWDKVCSCIHTRNDVLSSQDTIHPVDDRVLSIRELMRVMSIPSSFRWTDCDDKMTLDKADDYLKQNELNIRRCIGEAVPTLIVRNMALKIKMALGQTSDVQEKFYDDNKDFAIKSKKVDIKVMSSSDVVDFLPQIAGLFCEKNKVNLYCMNFTTEEAMSVNKVINDWDLGDFIIANYVTLNDEKTRHCNIVLENGLLRDRSIVQQLNF